MNSIEMDHAQVVELLLTVGADEAASDLEGRTFLEDGCEGDIAIGRGNPTSGRQVSLKG
jgi:hypothetical protein